MVAVTASGNASGGDGVDISSNAAFSVSGINTGDMISTVGEITLSNGGANNLLAVYVSLEHITGSGNATTYSGAISSSVAQFGSNNMTCTFWIPPTPVIAGLTNFYFQIIAYTKTNNATFSISAGRMAIWRNLN